MKIFKRIFIYLAIAALCIFALAFLLLPLPGQVPVLMYHFVRPYTEKYESNVVPPESFVKHMKYIKKFGYRVISLDELYEIKSGKRKGRGHEIAITFDDGNYTIKTEVYPILKSYQYPITVFMVSESMKTKEYGSLGIADVQELLKENWFKIGAHSMTHPFLDELSEEAIHEEVLGSKRELENIFNQPIDYFAYPYGNFDERVVRAVQEAGYKLAFTTAPKKLREISESAYTLTRVKMTHSSDNTFVFWFKATGIYNFLKHLPQRFKSV